MTRISASRDIIYSTPPGDPDEADDGPVGEADEAAEPTAADD